MYLTIITPAKTVFEGEVEHVTLPGELGPFQVLKGHAPLVSTLIEGPLTYQDKKGLHTIDIKGGVAEIGNDKVTILE